MGGSLRGKASKSLLEAGLPWVRVWTGNISENWAGRENVETRATEKWEGEREDKGEVSRVSK